jgi:hypothetical protein
VRFGFNIALGRGTLEPGTYKFTISNGICTFTSDPIVMQPLPAATLPTTVTQPTCQSLGHILVDATSFMGIVSPLPMQTTLSKEVDGSFVQIGSGTNVPGPTVRFGFNIALGRGTLEPGTYKFTISNGICTFTSDPIVMQFPLNMSVDLANTTQPTCPNGMNGAIPLTVTGFSGPYDVQAVKIVNGLPVPAVSLTAVSIPNPVLTNLSEGEYQITVSQGICTATTTVSIQCEALGREGCGTGYWKNNTDSWISTFYSPSQTVESVFDVPDAFGLDNITLLQALQSDGGPGQVGAAKILLRAAMTALLNARHNEVDYTITRVQIIADVNTALASGNSKLILQLAKTLDKYNNQNCPIDVHGTVVSGANRQSTVTDISSSTTELNLIALPNPSSGLFKLQIRSESTEKASMRIIDMHGRLIEHRHNLEPNQTLQIGANYGPGVYLVELIQGKTRKQVRILKMSK